MTTPIIVWWAMVAIVLYCRHRRRPRRAPRLSTMTLHVEAIDGVKPGDLLMLAGLLHRVDAVDPARRAVMLSPATELEQLRGKIGDLWIRVTSRRTR